MEPRVSMTAYAALLAAALVAASAFGHALFALVFSGSLLVYGSALHLLVYVRRRQRTPRAHRREEDRDVAAQWLLCGMTGLVASLVCLYISDGLGWDQNETAAIALGAAIGLLGIYVSAAFDWYYTHPRLAGLIGPAPCETAGNGRWVGLTNIWYFHRLAATFVVSAVLVGVPSTLSATAGSDAARNIWSFVTLSTTVFVLYTNKDYASVVRFLKNPRLSVGDVVLLIRPEWGGEPQRVYVLDVAVEGAKVKRLRRDDPVNVRPVDEAVQNLDDRTGDDPGPLGFLQKSDTTMLNDEIARCVHDPKDRPICRDGHCSGVNWYCRANRMGAARGEYV